ncbi:TniB family NTP-binding protein [Roseicyclus sp. F158]|uniref:TniB family NTP-binding protein n=1 Tax=Tropicimonas omnivorans TaxID=3075590 RepID=A0ABU3DHD6_9RHOB|nr:TniB family NTP-binding protein [Roseicyclus sp. F158]MDT0683106.1 TniB family NTP-binding protein [Roseicyclus sp. F158]
MDVNGNPIMAGEAMRAAGEKRGIAVVGGAGSGKTSLIAKAVGKHPALQPSEDALMPVVEITVPNPATVKSVGFEILKKTGYPELANRRTAWEIWNDVRTRFRLLGTRVLVIDEAHDLFPRKSKSEAYDILRTLKSLMQGNGSVVVVLCGIESLTDSISFDYQVQRRFAKFELPPVTTAADSKLIWGMIGKFCDRANLDRPKQTDLIDRLAHAGRYRLGICIEQIISAIEIALMRGDTQLDIQHFADAFFQQEGCEVDRNIFLSPRWSSIDLG